jgi:hypothetical protein
MNRVLATVGTNPVPVLAACRRLLDRLQPGELVLLCSDDTLGQAEAILKALTTAASFPTRPNHWRIVQVQNATAPNDISTTVSSQFIAACAPGDSVHLHYTGGTKAMGQHAMKALAVALQNRLLVKVDDSYLDPTIHQVVDQNGLQMDLAVADERRVWNLEVSDVARLHGLSTEFHINRGGRVTFGAGGVRTKVHVPNPPGDPTAGWVAIAWALAAGLAGNRALANRIGPSNIRWNSRWPHMPDPRNCAAAGFQWPPNGGAWNDIPAMMNSFFGRSIWNAAGEFDPIVLGEVELESVLRLFAGEWLEIVAADALRQALHHSRILTNYVVHGSTHFARIAGAQTTTFELDLVALLGYQLIVVSCSASADPKGIKRKGFEALHRAWQVGGQGARVIVLGLQSRAEAEQTANDLEMDLGGMLREPMQVWGLEEIGIKAGTPPRLVKSFRDYLDNLGWN